MSDSKHTDVLFLHTRFAVAGAERVIQSVASGLHRSGCHVGAMALYEAEQIGRQMAAEGIALYPIHARGRADLTLPVRFRSAMLQIRPRCTVVVDSPMSVLYGSLARSLRWTDRLVLSVHCFAKPGKELQWRIARSWARHTVDRIAALTDAHREHIVHTLGFTPNLVTVIPNGVDTDVYHPGEGVLRSGWQIPEGATVAALVARLRPDRNVRMALEALRACPEQLYLVIAGDGPERERLESCAAALGIAHRVRFVGMMEQTQDVWRSVDIAVCSSDAEILSMSLLESAASGIPAVATDVGSTHEIVLHERTGLLCAPGDWQAMSAALTRLASDPVLRVRLGSAARAHVETRFSRQSMLAAYQRLLFD